MAHLGKLTIIWHFNCNIKEVIICRGLYNTTKKAHYNFIKKIPPLSMHNLEYEGSLIKRTFILLILISARMCPHRVAQWHCLALIKSNEFHCLFISIEHGQISVHSRQRDNLPYTERWHLLPAYSSLQYENLWHIPGSSLSPSTTIHPP